MLQGSASDDAFHRLRFGSAAENVGVAALCAALLNRERPTFVQLIVPVGRPPGAVQREFDRTCLGDR